MKKQIVLTFISLLGGWLLFLLVLGLLYKAFFVDSKIFNFVAAILFPIVWMALVTILYKRMKGINIGNKKAVLIIFIYFYLLSGTIALLWHFVEPFRISNWTDVLIILILPFLGPIGLIALLLAIITAVKYATSR